MPGRPGRGDDGAWSEASVDGRLAAIDSCSVLPDFASVNWHEDGADEVAGRLLARGIGVEAGLWHADGLARWRVSEHRSRCLRVLVELPHLGADRVAAVAGELVGEVRAVGAAMPVLLHGEDRSAWPVLDLAGRWGLDTRIGLEDTLLLPDGTPTAGNADLVRAAVDRLRLRATPP